MITQTSAVAFRQNLGEMLNQVQYRHDSVVINKDGKPVTELRTPPCSSAFVACRSALMGFAGTLNQASKGFLRQTSLQEIEVAVALSAPRIVHHRGLVEPEMATLRVVLDTNVLLSGIAYSASIRGKIMAAWRHGSIEVILSAFILDELQRVLPRLVSRHGLTTTGNRRPGRYSVNSGRGHRAPDQIAIPNCGMRMTSRCWVRYWPRCSWSLPIISSRATRICRRWPNVFRSLHRRVSGQRTGGFDCERATPAP